MIIYLYGDDVWRRRWTHERSAAGRSLPPLRSSGSADDTDGTSRPNAKVGDGSTEAALREEARTGKPVGAVGGHAEKATNAVRTLQEAVTELRRLKPSLSSDAALVSEIDAAIARALQRIAALRDGLDVWNRRATLYPRIWNRDGTLRRPVGPVSPFPPEHDEHDHPDGASP